MLSRPSSPPVSGPKAFPKPSGMDRLKQMRKEMDNGAIGRSNEGIIVHVSYNLELNVVFNVVTTCLMYFYFVKYFTAIDKFPSLEKEEF